MKKECTNCGFNTFCEKFEDNEFCNICMNTQASKVSLYPTQCNMADVLSTMAYIGNKILEEIRNK